MKNSAVKDKEQGWIARVLPISDRHVDHLLYWPNIIQIYLDQGRISLGYLILELRPVHITF